VLRGCWRKHSQRVHSVGFLNFELSISSSMIHPRVADFRIMSVIHAGASAKFFRNRATNNAQNALLQEILEASLKETDIGPHRAQPHPLRQKRQRFLPERDNPARGTPVLAAQSAFQNELGPIGRRILDLGLPILR
jgi:hypothetical protein